MGRELSKPSSGRRVAPVAAGEREAVLYSYLLVCLVQLVIATLLLVGLGPRIRFPAPERGRLLAGVVAAVVAVGSCLAAAVVASDIWLLPTAPAEAAEVVLTVVCVV
jgi:hypothetical protein